MGRFKSNLNGISRTYGLTALKERLTTCFHNWRSKTVQSQQQFERAHHKAYAYAYVRTSESFKSFNTTFRKIFTPTKRRGRSSERVQIVTKLVSTTLIAASTGRVYSKEPESADDMTITDDSFLHVRDEYPYINAEVRSILMARSQEGATISEIKEDYRKNTGVKFPIANNITDFLLSIPSVMVYCNEQGTRVFNVIPSAKTKHIFDMIQKQKSIQEQSDHNRFPTLTGRKGLPSYLYKVAKQCPSYEPLLHNNYNKNNNINKHLDEDYRYIENACTGRTTPISASQMEVDPQPLGLQPAEMDVDISASEADVSPGNHYYQDNCKYLFNRLYNATSASTHIGHNFQSNNNNVGKKALNSNNALTKGPVIGKACSNALNQLNNLNTQPPESLRETRQCLNNNNNNNNKRKRVNSLTQQALPRPSHATSPTYTMSSRNNDWFYPPDSEYEARLLDFPLLGDDFFLYLARMELGCKFRKSEPVLQSGLCVSGQTIRDAIKRVQQMDECEKCVIVNIGSVDIMKGRSLVQIEHDYRQLIREMCRKRLTPILTTLAPLANYAHITQIKDRLQRFNQYIKRNEMFQVIDIWACLVNDRDSILFDCYQNEPRWVTGTKEAHLFWNKIGRQRVLQLIESSLEY